MGLKVLIPADMRTSGLAVLRFGFVKASVTGCSGGGGGPFFVLRMGSSRSRARYAEEEICRVAAQEGMQRRSSMTVEVVERQVLNFCHLTLASS